MIPYGKQNITEQDISAVVDVLKSDYLTQGPKIAEFEQALCQYTSAKYGTAVNSATSALHIACLALEVGQGDIVWTSPNSFVASSNCALYCGAKVDFIDIDLTNGNICNEQLALMLAQAQKNNTLPKAIIPVHFAGQSCDMEAIYQLCQPYGIKIIEDASHAIGGEYKDKKVGCCEFSDISIFSFHPVKIVTTAEGGIALTNQAKLHDAMQRLRSHGVTRDEALLQDKNQGPWYYEQLELGLNYRMTELQATLGLSQLARLDEFVKIRNDKASYYDHALAKVNLTTLEVKPHNYSSYHLYVIQLNNTEQHQETFIKLREAGIGVNLHYIPIPNQPYYQNLPSEFSLTPNAQLYYGRAISIPLYPDLTKNEQDYIISTIKGLVH